MNNNNQQKPKLLRRPAVEEMTGLKRSTIYAKMDKDEFPKPIKLGERMVAWLESDVIDWINARIASAA